MCSTKLLLWKNQKGSTRYPMILCKRYSTGDILLGIFNFFGQAISQNSSKPLIVKGFYMFKMSKCYCFCRAAQGLLSQCNRRNNALSAVVKSHKGLKGTKVFVFWVFCKKSQTFLKIYRKGPLLGSFYCKAAAWNSL